MTAYAPSGVPPQLPDFPTRPPLYHDRYEHDACGIGFVAQKDGGAATTCSAWP